MFLCRSSAADWRFFCSHWSRASCALVRPLELGETLRADRGDRPAVGVCSCATHELLRGDSSGSGGSARGLEVDMKEMSRVRYACDNFFDDFFRDNPHVCNHSYAAAQWVAALNTPNHTKAC